MSDAITSNTPISRRRIGATISNGAEFEVAVTRTGTGEVLERFDSVTARSLLSLESDHVRFAEIG